MKQLLIPQALLAAAERGSANRGYTFLDGPGEKFLSYKDLYVRGAKLAAALSVAGVSPGGRVGLILPDNDRFVISFFGAMHGGFIPVPIAPPMNIGRLTPFLEHLRHVVKKSGMSLIITSPRIKSLLGSLIGGTLKQVCTFDELRSESESPAEPAAWKEADCAFLQFTSGSTAQPKGVSLSHGNLSANVHCIMNEGLKVNSEDVGCSWLPLFHDMGLIGFVISPVLTETPIVLASPLLFVKNPASWLQLISKHRASISFGPNFAYGLCTKRVKEAELHGVDLSSWRIAGCGAEPIQAATLEHFARRFAAHGFRADAFVPSYGLAESTVAVTFSSPGTSLKIDQVNLTVLAEQRTAVSTESAQGAVRLVSCGSPFTGHELAIRGADGSAMNEREVGEIFLRGPSVMQGYYEDAGATGEAIQGGWLRTGDLGYMHQGELYICGRSKEVIIVSGRNYYPNDLEFALADIEGIRKGNVVAFGIADVVHGEEHVIVCAETRSGPDEYPEIEKAVVSQILQSFGIRVNQVVLLEANSLPKTSSGKLQRTKTKQLYLDGMLVRQNAGDEKLNFVKHWAVSQWNYLLKGLS